MLHILLMFYYVLYLLVSKYSGKKIGEVQTEETEPEGF